jgi:hypothetical protein
MPGSCRGGELVSRQQALYNFQALTIAALAWLSGETKAGRRGSKPRQAGTGPTSSPLTRCWRLTSSTRHTGAGELCGCLEGPGSACAHLPGRFKGCWLQGWLHCWLRLNTQAQGNEASRCAFTPNTLTALRPHRPPDPASSLSRAPQITL